MDSVAHKQNPIHHLLNHRSSFMHWNEKRPQLNHHQHQKSLHQKKTPIKATLPLCHTHISLFHQNCWNVSDFIHRNFSNYKLSTKLPLLVANSEFTNIKYTRAHLWEAAGWIKDSRNSNRYKFRNSLDYHSFLFFRIFLPFLVASHPHFPMWLSWF